MDSSKKYFTGLLALIFCKSFKRTETEERSDELSDRIRCFSIPMKSFWLVKLISEIADLAFNFLVSKISLLLVQIQVAFWRELSFISRLTGIKTRQFACNNCHSNSEVTFVRPVWLFIKKESSRTNCNWLRSTHRDYNWLLAVISLPKIATLIRQARYFPE